MGLLAGAMSMTAAPAMAAAPAAARPALEVRLGTQPVRLNSAGQVPLAFRVRCAPGVQAFELDASVQQATAYGSVTLAAPPFVATCDGTWHRVVVKVSPETGSVPGRQGRVDAWACSATCRLPRTATWALVRAARSGWALAADRRTTDSGP